MTVTSHPAAPLPANESQRLEALAAYGILDTPFEGDFDDIVRIASQICETPIAIVSLVEQGRQWFKAEVGLNMRQTPIDSSICAHAILQPELFEIPDTQLDSRSAFNPLVTGDPRLRFYAGAPLRTPDGYQLGTVCVLDSKPRKLTLAQREALMALSRQTMALMELRRALRAADSTQKHLRRLLTTAGHDLRQPLQLINLSLDMARSRSADPAAIVKSTDLALDACQRLATELDALALAASNVAELIEPEETAFPIQEHFDALQRMWQPQAERKRLKLRFAPSSLQVVSDPRMLDTILGNLIGNAIKYTQTGGILVGCRRMSDKVRIDVIDTGVGIAADQQDQMFDSFRKVDVRSEGLGLGLAIVRNTADLLGVPVQMKSAPGRGTVVSLILPLAA